MTNSTSQSAVKVSANDAVNWMYSDHAVAQHWLQNWIEGICIGLPDYEADSRLREGDDKEIPFSRLGWQPLLHPGLLADIARHNAQGGSSRGSRPAVETLEGILEHLRRDFESLRAGNRLTIHHFQQLLYQLAVVRQAQTALQADWPMGGIHPNAQVQGWASLIPLLHNMGSFLARTLGRDPQSSPNVPRFASDSPVGFAEVEAFGRTVLESLTSKGKRSAARRRRGPTKPKLKLGLPPEEVGILFDRANYIATVNRKVRTDLHESVRTVLWRAEQEASRRREALVRGTGEDRQSVYDDIDRHGIDPGLLRIKATGTTLDNFRSWWTDDLGLQGDPLPPGGKKGLRKVAWRVLVVTGA